MVLSCCRRYTLQHIPAIPSLLRFQRIHIVCIQGNTFRIFRGGSVVPHERCSLSRIADILHRTSHIAHRISYNGGPHFNRQGCAHLACLPAFPIGTPGSEKQAFAMQNWRFGAPQSEGMGEDRISAYPYRQATGRPD